MSGSLQYERPVPKFLQAYIKPKVHFDSDEPSVADGDQSNSAKAKIEERPDRDDEAPQIENADEYEKELEHGLVDGIAAVTKSEKSSAADADVAELENAEDAENIIADPLASSVNFVKPLMVGGKSDQSRVEDARAAQIEAQTGGHAFRKSATAQKRSADTSADAPKERKKTAPKGMLSFNMDDEA